MEIFCKVIAEDMINGNRRIAGTAFLTFVALDENKRPMEVPGVIPETEEEKSLYDTGFERAEVRKTRRKKSKEVAESLTVLKPWEITENDSE
jgi:acyl-CoA hydrolase